MLFTAIKIFIAKRSVSFWGQIKDRHDLIINTIIAHATFLGGGGAEKRVSRP